METRIFLFQGANVLVPETYGDDELSRGVDRELAERCFGAVSCYTAPPFCAAVSADGTAAAEAARESGMTGVLLEPEAALPPGWRTAPVRQVLTALAAEGRLSETKDGSSAGEGSFGTEGFAVTEELPGAEDGPPARLLRLYHLLQWRKDSAHCGSCGEKNGDSPAELARLCPRCGRIEYPRISPAVIVLVTRDDGSILLAHNKKFRPGLYSLVAGFAEAGESLEAAARREILEEVNVEVKDIRYVASQSWPFPNSLMAGFSARYAGGEIKPDEVEIVDARWFSAESVRGGVPEIPSPGSVSRYLINRWLAGTPEVSGHVT